MTNQFLSRLPPPSIFHKSGGSYQTQFKVEKAPKR